MLLAIIAALVLPSIILLPPQTAATLEFPTPKVSEPMITPLNSSFLFTKHGIVEPSIQWAHLRISLKLEELKQIKHEVCKHTNIVEDILGLVFRQGKLGHVGLPSNCDNQQILDVNMTKDFKLFANRSLGCYAGTRIALRTASKFRSTPCFKGSHAQSWK